jgi:hypothetical protein
MTNFRITRKGPWSVRPSAIGDGKATITFSAPGNREVVACETASDLALLRDALTEYLAPEQPTGPTHLAVFSVIDADGATGSASLPVEIAPGGLDFDGALRIISEARAEFGATGVQLVNLIPLAGA